MRKLERLNLKSTTTLSDAEMRQILGGMTTTKPPLKKCKSSASECVGGECDVTLEVKGTCQIAAGTGKCICVEKPKPPTVTSF